MVKIKTYIFLFFFIMLASLQAYERDTIAVLHIANIQLSSPDTLQFDINIENIGEWQRYVNGTFYIQMASGGNIDFETTPLKIDYVSGTSELNMGPVTGTAILPVSDYNVYQEAVRDTFKITLVGPRVFGNCTVVNSGEKKKIGTFRITTANPPPDSLVLSEKLFWLQPYKFYQASAYKLENDSTVFGIEMNYDDNIELDDWCCLLYTSEAETVVGA